MYKIIFFILLTYALYSQESIEINNGSFELAEYNLEKEFDDPQITYFGEYGIFIKDWYFDNTFFDKSPPNHFCKTSNSEFYKEYSFNISLNPSDGKCYIAMVARDDETYEGIYYHLSKPLQPYNLYYFYVDVAASDRFFALTENSGMLPFLKPAVLKVYGFNNVSNKELLYQSESISSNYWKRHKVLLNPSAEFNYILFEVGFKDTEEFSFGHILIDNVSDIKIHENISNDSLINFNYDELLLCPKLCVNYIGEKFSYLNAFYKVVQINETKNLVESILELSDYQKTNFGHFIEENELFKDIFYPSLKVLNKIKTLNAPKLEINDGKSLLDMGTFNEIAVLYLTLNEDIIKKEIESSLNLIK